MRACFLSEALNLCDMTHNGIRTRVSSKGSTNKAFDSTDPGLTHAPLKRH